MRRGSQRAFLLHGEILPAARWLVDTCPTRSTYSLVYRTYRGSNRQSVRLRLSTPPTFDIDTLWRILVYWQQPSITHCVLSDRLKPAEMSSQSNREAESAPLGNRYHSSAEVPSSCAYVAFFHFLLPLPSSIAFYGAIKASFARCSHFMRMPL